MKGSNCGKIVVMDKVLVVAAHPDDEIIGLGGTLQKHIKNGEDVEVLILGDGKTSRDKSYKAIKSDLKEKSLSETEKALKILGVKKFHREFLPDNRFDNLVLLDIVKIVSDYIKNYLPTIIYTHHYGDLNVDHQLTSEAVIISTRPIEYPQLKELRMFETLSSTEMAGARYTHTFIPNLFVNIENELGDKLKAMGCYASELRDFPHPRSLKAIEYNAYVWGAKNNQRAVEPFYIFRKNEQ
jgi:LmbE family N-acetylglucosaminyl deacetylase